MAAKLVLEKVVEGKPALGIFTWENAEASCEFSRTQ